MDNTAGNDVPLFDSKDNVQLLKTSFWRKFPLFAFFLGIICLSFWLSQLLQDEHQSRAIFSYMFSYMFFLAIALGAMGFVLLQHLTRAGWSVVVRRVAESAMATIPLFILLFIPIAIYKSDLFEWTHMGADDHILQWKKPYLNITFFYIRAFGYFICWLFISLWFYYQSIKQDSGSNSATFNMRGFSAPAIMIFALSITFASFDWLMSLQPHWYSTIFGVYYFATAILSVHAFMAIIFLLLHFSGYLKTIVTTEHFHDLGKYIFGFTVFWAYIAFSQFILIWYANIPEETEFYILRLHGGWEVISWLMPITHFFIPFFLLVSRHVKRNKLGLFIASCWTLLVQALGVYWLVLPMYGAHGEGHHTYLDVNFTDIICFIGIGMIFLSLFCKILSRGNLVALGDPRIKESVNFENY